MIGLLYFSVVALMKSKENSRSKAELQTILVEVFKGRKKERKDEIKNTEIYLQSSYKSSFIYFLLQNNLNILLLNDSTTLFITKLIDNKIFH